MRLKIIISPKQKKCFIPFNYQHSLSSAIYDLISISDSNYSKYLHDNGIKSDDGKPLKFFTFSYLVTPYKEISNNKILIRNQKTCYFYVSSPYIDEFVKNFVIGIFEKQELNISDSKFDILKVEAISTPVFREECNFKCLSPFVLSTMQVHNGRLKPHYLRPDDKNLSEAVRNNLMRKYKTLYQQEPEISNLQFSLDNTYIRRHNPKNLTKLIILKEGQGNRETRIKGIFAPFKMKGSIELMKIAWEAGLGAHCSQGFGCIELIN